MSADPILVTGAGGLIGGAVCRALVAAGRDVTAWVGPPGFEPSRPVPAARRVLGEITDAELVRELVAGHPEIVHLAGPPSVARSFREPVEFMRAHVVGTATLLTAVGEVGARRLVHVSSAEVYGSTGPGGVVREDRPPTPRSPYGIAKLAAEQLVLRLTAERSGEAVVLRPFSVYGPGSPPWSIVGTVLGQVRGDPGADDGAREVTLAIPTAVRDYCYVDDVAGAVLRALDVPLHEPVPVLNVGSGVGRSGHELAAAAGAALGRAVTVRQGAGDRPPDGFLPELVADVSRAAEVLGWSASTSLTEGLRRTAAEAGAAA